MIEGLCGTSKRWTDRLRGNRGSEGRGRGSTPLQPPCSANRTDLEPHSSEPLFAEFDLILCILWMPTLFPEGLAGLSGPKWGDYWGEFGTKGHEWTGSTRA